MRQRVVILKGAEGFADRMQCLMQAIRYASATCRTLVVDWRDEDWSHDPSGPLSDYLSIEGLDTLAIADFLDQLKNAPPPDQFSQRHGVITSSPINSMRSCVTPPLSSLKMVPA